jgi:hypothetical protein
METKERPMIFSGEMVRAILENRKTQTRRIIKPQPEVLYVAGFGIGRSNHSSEWCGFAAGHDVPWDEWRAKAIKSCPYEIEMKLWVRETWANIFVPSGTTANKNIVVYRADEQLGLPVPQKWNSPIRMFRWASRITLEIINVSIERLQDISEEDCIAEGIPQYTFARGCISDNPPDPRWGFIELWDSINGKKYPWESNPFVWKIEFRKVEK